jgi:putative glutamine amidotransferase
MRPKIGITMDVGQPDLSRKTLELPADYAHAVLRAGGLPLLLPFTHDPAVRLEMIAAVDGLLIPGGDDLDPRLYGQEPHPKNTPADRERQDFDLALLALAEQRQLPTLGVCMGCQTMNVQRRGTLHQHLPDVPPPYGTPPADAPAALAHRKPGDRMNAHEVAVRPGSALARALGLDRLDANSRHHQGIAKLGHGLVPTAFAPDGLVEALEDPTLPFWVAVQWHPENLAGTPHDRLFQALVEAARVYRERRRDA